MIGAVIEVIVAIVTWPMEMLEMFAHLGTEFVNDPVAFTQAVQRRVAEDPMWVAQQFDSVLPGRPVTFMWATVFDGVHFALGVLNPFISLFQWTFAKVVAFLEWAGSLA